MEPFQNILKPCSLLMKMYHLDQKDNEGPPSPTLYQYNNILRTSVLLLLSSVLLVFVSFLLLLAKFSTVTITALYIGRPYDSDLSGVSAGHPGLCKLYIIMYTLLFDCMHMYDLNK